MNFFSKVFGSVMDDVTKALDLIKKDRESKCNHGVTFDEKAAIALLENAPLQYPNLDPAAAFIAGSPAVPEIRKRWPRLCGKCPKGCGYDGIYYASREHYIMGDW